MDPGLEGFLRQTMNGSWLFNKPTTPSPTTPTDEPPTRQPTRPQDGVRAGGPRRLIAW